MYHMALFFSSKPVLHGLRCTTIIFGSWEKIVYTAATRTFLLRRPLQIKRHKYIILIENVCVLPSTKKKYSY